MTGVPHNRILIGDVRRELRRLPAGSVDTVITSPPYYLLRDYGIDGQLGLEPSVHEWVDELRLVMRGVARVLKPTGSLWLNLGDSYSRHPRFGGPSKSLLLGPERLVLALVADGWIVRNKLIWAKTNSMPNSVRDRFACTWEVIYFLVRSRKYFFDLDAARVPVRSSPPRASGHATSGSSSRPAWAGRLAGSNSGLANMKAAGRIGHPLGKNPGDVITTAASNYRGAHFATFPEVLIERPLVAGCPERVCRRCGRPWERQSVDRNLRVASLGQLQSSCSCRAEWRPGLVLDPFFGSGTVGLVAERLHRDWLGIELNPGFARLAEQRIGQQRPKVGRDGSQPRAA